MNTMSRRRLLSAALAGAAAAGLAGCSRAQAGGGAPPLRATTYIPSSYDDLYPGIELFLDTATKASGGALSFDLYDSGSLLSAEGLLPGLLLEVTDVAFQTSSYVTSSFPILGATQLPFAINDLGRNRRAVDPDGALIGLTNEWLATQNVHLLGGMPTGFEYMWTIDAPIRKPEDVAGRRIRVAGEIEGATIKALGGAPVFMGSSEVYEALERGTIDGMVSYVGTIVSRDLHQIIRYGTAARFGAYTVDAYCRKDWYDDRPAAARAALDEAGRDMYRRGAATMRSVHEKDYLPTITQAGVELVQLSEAELDAFRRSVEPVYGHWRSMLGNDAVAAQAVDMIERA
jgi:TRAP-type C4-dicarboxylate transport system substrate-binding protein